jgi:putative transposase
MTLSVHLLMHIYQGVSLNWRLNADVLVIGASGSCCVRRAFTSITKRVYRIYHLNELSVKRRRRRKGLATERFPHRPDANLTWSMDFVMDALANGRRIKCLNCVDNLTKVSDSYCCIRISGVQITRILDSITLFRGYPATIRTDQGPDYQPRTGSMGL